MTFVFNDTKNIYGTIWVISKANSFQSFQGHRYFLSRKLVFLLLNLVEDEKIHANVPEIRTITWDYRLWQKCLKWCGTPWLTRVDESIEIQSSISTKQMIESRKVFVNVRRWSADNSTQSCAFTERKRTAKFLWEKPRYCSECREMFTIGRHCASFVRVSRLYRGKFTLANVSDPTVNVSTQITDLREQPRNQSVLPHLPKMLQLYRFRIWIRRDDKQISRSKYTHIHTRMKQIFERSHIEQLHALKCHVRNVILKFTLEFTIACVILLW